MGKAAGDEVYELTQQDVAVLQRMERLLRNIRSGPGIDIQSDPAGGLVISLKAPAAPATAVGRILLGLAQLTAAGADAAHWQWKYAKRNTSTGKWQAPTPGLGSDDLGECVIADAGAGRVGLNGLLYWQQDTSQQGVLTLVPINTRGLIAVSLTADGGSDGSTTTTPSYTYKWPVDLTTGDEIKKADTTRATGMAPTWSRSKGSYNQAAYGTVYINSSGNPVLFQCDETEKTCT